MYKQTWKVFSLLIVFQIKRGQDWVCCLTYVKDFKSRVKLSWCSNACKKKVYFRSKARPSWRSTYVKKSIFQIESETELVFNGCKKKYRSRVGVQCMQKKGERVQKKSIFQISCIKKDTFIRFTNYCIQFMRNKFFKKIKVSRNSQLV